MGSEQSKSTLNELAIGESAVITTVGGEGALRQHFLDMGVIPGARVTLVKLAPMGDPMELRIHGYELTLRLDDAAQIGIEPATDDEPLVPERTPEPVHPGFGEEGERFHPKGSGTPLPEDTVAVEPAPVQEVAVVTPPAPVVVAPQPQVVVQQPQVVVQQPAPVVLHQKYAIHGVTSRSFSI